MNIMKTNMLLLDNKIMKEDGGNTTTQAPVPSTNDPQKGMKALSFLGMRNLMANPKLAQGIGVMNDKMAETSSAKSYVAPYSSNIAFKGGFQNVAKAAVLTAVAGLGAASLQSCARELKSEQTQIVYIDNEALIAAIESSTANLQAQIDELVKLLAQKDADQAERDKQVIAALTSVINLLNSMNDKIDKQSISFDEFKLMIYGQNSAILDAIVLLQNITKEEAKAMVDRILEAYKNGLIDIKTAMAQIQELLQTNNDLLTQMLAVLQNLQAAAEKANEQRAELLGTTNEILKYQKVSVSQQQAMMNQLNVLIQQNNVQIYNQQQTINAIKQTGADLKASIYEVAQYLGVKVDYLAEVIAITGKSITDIMTMSKEEIIALLEAHLKELQEANNKLNDVNNNLNNLNGSVEDNTDAIIDAAEEITNILNEISAKLDELSKQFAEAVEMFRGKLNRLISYAKGCYKNGQINNTMLENLNNQLFDIKNEVINIKITAKEIKNDIQNGISIDFDSSEIKELLKILNLSINSSADEIIAKLDEYIAGQEKIEIAINKLGDENSSNLEYIANLIKTKTVDNSDVIAAIQALAEANEDNIAAATELLAAKLDKLIAKVNAILNKMDDLASVLKQYGDQLLAKLDVNDEILKEIKVNGNLLRDANGKLDLTNMSLAQLQAEVEKIAPQLQKLINNTNTANGYLDIISKKQIEIDEHILDLGNIGGGGITAEELEALWIQHDAAAYAKFKEYMDGIHADNMDKADEIIGYLKKNNATAGDVYQLLIEFKNQAGDDAEALKKLLQAVYDYLPELKCNCSCDCDDNDNVHEGIIDIIS